MTVRAKFRLVGWKNTLGSRPVIENGKETGKWEETLMCSLEFSAVYSNSPENRKFWNATPSGKIEINIVNPEAVKEFDLGKEYYVDFTTAT